MQEKNLKQDIELTKIQKDVCYLKQEVSEIKRQVFNHLPTKIQDISDNFQKFKLTNSRWQISILITLLFLLVGVIINLIK